MQTVGQIVRHRRQAMGLTLASLAHTVGATKSYLSMIENHRVTGPPSANLLANLENALAIADGELRRAAEWQATPHPVKLRFQEIAESAREGKHLARWLKQSTSRHQGGGKNLDKLYRSGQLSRRVNALLENEADDHTPLTLHAALTPDVPVRYRVPLINQVAAGYPTGFTDLDYPARVADQYINCPDLVDPDAFAARVVGQSMTPDYREGDIIVFSPAAEITDGCDCFVRLEPNHETTFKRIYFDTDDTGDTGDTGPTLIRLQPLNPKFPPTTHRREHIAGMYRAVWRYARL